MKILSYNLYGKKDVDPKTPSWSKRQSNLKRIISEIIDKENIDLLFFQEVNQNNMDLVEKICHEFNFLLLPRFPMITRTILQYNIIAIKKAKEIEIIDVHCVPHGGDLEYQNPERQIIDYGMSDYRTTIFINFRYNNKTYLLGNIHTDYKSSEGIIKGTVKSLNYMDSISSDYKLIVGDMNMAPENVEVIEILKYKPNYQILIKNKNTSKVEPSYHGYGLNIYVHVDFAFIEKDKETLYDYKLICQQSLEDEGSDHRPVIITIN